MRTPRVSIDEKIFQPLLLDEGWVVKKDNVNPHIYYLSTPDGIFNASFKFIFRNVTNQGRFQDDKRRMQVKKFELNSSGKNILIGWSEEFDVFVAWDARIHNNHGVSSMVSCYVDVLEEAKESGFASGSRKNKMLGQAENYISFTPDFLNEFLQISDEIFQHGNMDFAELEEIDDLSEEEAAAAEEEEEDEEVVESSSIELTTEADFERTTIERIVQLKVRDQRFRKKMLSVYQSECAVCRINGKDILQGAHIIPVSKGGTDEEKNGLLLCANHHLLYDRGHLNIDENLNLAVSKTYSDQQWYKDLVTNYNGKIHAPNENVPGRANLSRRFSM